MGKFRHLKQELHKLEAPLLEGQENRLLREEVTEEEIAIDCCALDGYSGDETC